MEETAETAETANARWKWSLAGAVGAGLLASACCTVPLLLITIGVGGAWLSTLRALEPLRPLFLLIAFGLLFAAWRRVDRAAEAETCEPGTACADPRTHRRNRWLLWLAAVVTLLLAASPGLVGLLTQVGN